MTKNNKQALQNGAAIIERFGGIRPMAAKISTPVTTVQGWKKRDVIPGTRRDQILEAASENNIDLSDLMEGSDVANQNSQKENVQVSEEPQTKENKETYQEEKTVTPILSSRSSLSSQSEEEKTSGTEKVTSTNHDELVAMIEENNRKMVVRSTWIAAGLILLTLGASVVFLWPSVKDSASQMEQQSEQIGLLEDEVKDVNMRTSFIKRIAPEKIQKKMDELQTQAQNIQTTVNQLSEKAEAISSGVLSADSGPLSERLKILENKMTEFSGQDNNFGGLIERLRLLEETIPGQAQLKDSVTELQKIVGDLDSQKNLDENLEEAQSDADGALGQTLEGVSGNDLKAAAMLIAFSQLRDSFNRNEPFENDLALLQKLAGPEDVELQAALMKLAPHANGGVLTSEGLSSEFKGLTGDIVVASLKGEEVSFSEKAKARMNKLFRVEKDGELVTGTNTQTTIAKAQTLLDAGDVQGAITELQALEGEAADKAQPFIKQAEVSLLAEQVQQMLGENILSKLSTQLPVSGMSNMLNGNAVKNLSLDGLNMDEVKKNLEKAVPLGGSGDVVRDEESGVTILPGQSGFKGFSSGQ